ncbi:MmgE/PrpD family protein [Knoellia locipacati]|uniref:MmgE/PrpD family protein n=1 Tax=Knoellia locipacati TaxID=882824 RepID=UPI0038516001
MDTAAAGHTDVLGHWAAGLEWRQVPIRVQDRLRLVLLDVLGVTLVGSHDPEQQRLVDVWELPPGLAPLVGCAELTSIEAACWLNATALVRLELDEGNKFAKGHPAAHGFPAVLALAAARNAPPGDLLAALVVAYEVASRFGRATSLRDSAHPHGSWGVAGAAAGCARLLGLDGESTAAAVDAAAGMPIAGHFATALDGNRVRDAWVAAANVSGLNSARLAAAGSASNTGTAAYSLGTMLGTFDPGELTAELGVRWDIELGYFKQHAACSFTHAAADAVLDLAVTDDLPDVAAIESITVETHSLATGLRRRSWDNQLSAMFSIPFVVAAALVHGEVGPAVTRREALADPAVRLLAQRVDVVGAADLDARLPAERPVRVTVEADGRQWVVERPNPVGDSAFQPFDESALGALLRRLLGPDHEQELTTVMSVVDDLFCHTSGGAALRDLASPAHPIRRSAPAHP